MRMMKKSDPGKEKEEDDYGNGNSQMLLDSFLEDFKDGSSDSDSSAILSEEIAINKNKKSEDEQQQKQQMVEIHSGCSSSFLVVKIENTISSRKNLAALCSPKTSLPCSAGAAPMTGINYLDNNNFV